MDFANLTRSLTGNLTSEVINDCNRLCFNEVDGVPSTDCVKNCTYKQV